MSEDLLNRGPFIDLLNQIITQKAAANEGFSFAIDGKWGCGKSWILKELEQELESQNYLVIHYNCWENEYYEEPLVALLSIIIDKLNSLQNSLTDGVKKEKLKIALSFFAKVSSTILTNKLGIGFDDILKAGIEAIHKDHASSTPTSFDNNQNIKETLKSVRGQLLQLKNVLSEGTDSFTNIVIVVDELDRCLPEYAIKVMQRLHHICFDTESDKFTFIQLAAINKSELLGSIAKTFGREFNLTQKYTSSGDGSGSIFYDNFDEFQIQFGNYYFKKFFQMIIPVSNGETMNNPLSLVNGLGFDPVYPNEKQYVERFFTEVLCHFPMRTKLELVHLVKTAHQITAMNTSLDKPLRYNILCIELIDSLCRSILKKNYPKVLHQKNKDQNHELYLHIDNLRNIEGISDSKYFENAFKNWSLSSCGYLERQRGDKKQTIHPFVIEYPESYIKAFYERSETIIIRDSAPDPSEIAFIEAFRKTLDVLV